MSFLADRELQYGTGTVYTGMDDETSFKPPPGMHLVRENNYFPPMSILGYGTVKYELPNGEVINATRHGVFHYAQLNFSPYSLGMSITRKGAIRDALRAGTMEMSGNEDAKDRESKRHSRILRRLGNA